MKNKYYLLTLMMVFLTLTGSVLFTACEKEEEGLDTNQLGSTEITLKSFGPSPAMRGCELRFIGTNLDKVTSIDIPGATGLIDITVVSQYEIRITIPQTAEPGIVKLNTPTGVISTLTPIGYSEPISINSFEPTAIKAGQTLKINGEYLNIVEEVILAGGVHVLKEDFVSQSREVLELKVPETAQTGKIIVSNGADLLSDGEEIPTWIYSEADLTVTLPSISEISPNPVKAGTVLTIKGADLDLVKSVVFGGDLTVDEFKMQSATQIELDVPENAEDGKITLIPASGVYVFSSSDLVMVVPTVSVSPAEIKNGGTLTVTGTNLDLITGVSFAGEVQGTIMEGGTTTQISVMVPDLAVTGDVVFTTTSKKTVNGGSVTIIVPTLTDFAPNAVKPNSDIVINGTNLDIVSEVKFTGDIAGSIISQSETSLTVTVPLGAKNGVITLVSVNGVEVSSTSEIEILSNLPSFESYSESKGTPGAILTINGIKMDLIKELVFPGEITATAYGTKTDAKIEVYVPEEVETGMGQIRMITYEGDEGLLPELFFGGTDPITSETLMISDFDGGGASQSKWSDVVTFGEPEVYFNGTAAMHGLSGSGWQWTWANNWDYIPALDNPGEYVIKFDVCITKPVADLEVGMMLRGWTTSVNLGYPFSNSTNGQWVTMTFDVLTSDMLIDGEDGIGLWINGTDYDLTGIMIDNLRYDPK